MQEWKMQMDLRIQEIIKQQESHTEQLKVNKSLQAKDDEELEKRLSARIKEISQKRPASEVVKSEDIETSTEKTGSKPMQLTSLNISGDADELIKKLQEELNQRLQEQDKNRQKLEKEVKKLKQSLTDKADREAVIDGQQ